MTGAGASALRTAPAAAGPAGRPDGYECARAWSALTAAHTRITGQLSAALDRQCGLSVHEFEILLRVEGAGEPGARLGELSAVVPLTQPALSRAVTRLCGRGCLSRAGVPQDRRGILIAVTPAGRDLLRRAVPVHAATIRELLLDQLSPAEQDLLARALSRVASDRPPSG